MAVDLLKPHARAWFHGRHPGFAARLPMAIICQMLGFPRQDEDMLRGGRTRRFIASPTGSKCPRKGRSPSASCSHISRPIWRGARSLRRATTWSARCWRPRRASPQPCRAARLMLILSIAGNETTTKLIGNMVYQLHRHPEQRALPPGRSGPAALGDRGDDALRRTHPDDGADDDPRRRAARTGHSRRQEGGADLHFGEP